MDADRIKTAQRQGWVVCAADEEALVLRCPSQGCGVRMKIREGTAIPSCDPGLRRNPGDVPIGSYADLRGALRYRRQELCLSISETEEIAGFTADHVAKFEQPAVNKNQRMPSFESVVTWAGALGFEVVLRPTDLPGLASRILSETRPKVQRRKEISRRSFLRAGQIESGER